MSSTGVDSEWETGEPVIMLTVIERLVLCLLLSLAGSVARCQEPETSPPAAIGPFDRLASIGIPSVERFPWQPPEVVAVLGSHRWKHWGWVNSVAFSPDEKIVASSGNDGVRLWDRTGKELAAMTTDSDVNSLAFHPDGKKLLAGDESGTIHVWELGSFPPKSLEAIRPRELLARLPTPPAVDSISFSANGKLLACTVGHQLGQLVLWDASVWPPRQLPSLPGATGPYAFGPDGKTLVTQKKSGDILIWDMTGDQMVKVGEGNLPVARHQMLAMAISPDGQSLVTCHEHGSYSHFPKEGFDGDIVLWDLSKNPPSARLAFGSFKSDAMYYLTASAVFGADSKTLAFASHAREIELWDLATDPPKMLSALTGDISQAGTVSFSRDGTTLATVGKGVILWDLGDALPRRLTGDSASFPHNVLHELPKISGDGKCAALTESGNMTQLWDLTGINPKPIGEPIAGVPLFPVANGKLWTMQFQEMTGLVEGEEAVAAKLLAMHWDVSGPRAKRIGDALLPFDGRPGSLWFFDVSESVMTIGLRSDGENRVLRFFASGAVETCLLPVAGESELHPRGMSDDGRFLAANTGDYESRIVKVWDVSGKSAREVAKLKGTSVIGSNVSPEIGVIEGSETRPLNVWSLALAPNGDAIALADIAGTIQVWNLSLGEQRLMVTLKGHKEGRVMGAVREMSFSRDGNRLLTIGSDQELKVWDIASGNEILTTSLPDTEIQARFAPDGRHIVTSNTDGTAFILRIPLRP